jgi:DNA invertase Pin-like site-specific DNA recombinase
VAIYRDEGISGTKGRDRRPGLDALLEGVAHREFDIVAASSVCRLGRSLPDLISPLRELRSREIDLYLHQQAFDTSTPAGRMLLGPSQFGGLAAIVQAPDRAGRRKNKMIRAAMD